MRHERRRTAFTPAAALTAVTLLAGDLPGSVPSLVIEQGGKTSDWWIKGATFLVLIFTKALDYLLLPGAMIALFLNYIAGAFAKLG